MTSDHHIGKGYAPLPQSMSNTDTEDEDEHIIQRNDLMNKEYTNTTTMEPVSTHGNGAFYPLDETRNLANRTRNGQNTLRYYRDDIPIMVIEGNSQNDLWKPRDMSPLRRFCLIMSILLCITTILVFLYVLPCDSSMVCPPVLEPQSSVSWDKTLQNVEIYGPITIVPGYPHNLIFLLRGQQYNINNTDPTKRTIEKKALVSIQGSNGLDLWLLRLERTPTNIDCLSIDTDRSGSPDCIIVGEHGLLKSIEPIAGVPHWSSSIHTFPSLPVILPDINLDGIEDLLSVETMENNTSSLVLISGRTGELLGRYLKHNNCSDINIYSLVSNGTISCLCHNTSKKCAAEHLSLEALLHGSNFSQRHFDVTTMPRYFETMKFHRENSWQLTHYHHLFIKNEGSCPQESCKAYVNLSIQKQVNNSLTIWEHLSPNTIVSEPAFLVTLGKQYSTAFAIKSWQWNDLKPAVTDTMSRIFQRKLTEKVVVIFVNYTDVQVINASQSDIVQLCRNEDCQPNLNFRTEFSSLIVANISRGHPELISYWSSYNDNSSKSLMSKVQVVNLDSVITDPAHANT